MTSQRPLTSYRPESSDPGEGGKVEPIAEYDRFARLVRTFTGAPTSTVAFMTSSEQVFLGADGLPAELASARRAPLGHSFCQLVVNSGTPLVVSDARGHSELHTHPAVVDYSVVAYAGYPVRDSSGTAVAALCAFDYAPRQWSAEDLAVLEDLAAACATELQLREERTVAVAARVAAERSDAFTTEFLEERRGVAHTLQAAMLTDLPQPEGVALEAVYAPAAEGEEVGGDWYDALVLADGGFALAVGDITGHDIRAAAVMGQMRSMLRALLWEHDKSPSLILSLLDDISIGTGLGASGTALLARLEPATGGTRRLLWSSAGHPFPLVLRADGSVEVPGGRPDPMLGFRPGCVRTERWIDLDPGDCVVMFTDGLIERRGETFADGINNLVAQVRSGNATPSGLLTALAPPAVREDDVVVLTALLSA